MNHGQTWKGGERSGEKGLRLDFDSGRESFWKDSDHAKGGRLGDWDVYMNECIDSTMGRIHVYFAVLLASDDPRTSWSFQLVARSLFFTGRPERRTF